MSRKYKRGNTSLTVYDVRDELYGMLSDMRRCQNDHCSAYQQHPDGHRMPCAVCVAYHQKRYGIKLAIARFGGRAWKW